MVVLAIHWHESTTGAHLPHHSELPFYLPLYPIPLSCPGALALSALLHASNLHWSSISHMVIYISMLFPQIVPKVCCFLCVSFAALHKGSWFSSVKMLSLTLSDPMECSMRVFPVHCQLPELAQIHVYLVCDAIQPSHPLSSSSPPAFNLSQHQSLFQWVSSSHQVAKVLEFQLQHQSFQWIFRTDLLRMDWLDLLAVQRTLKSLLQHHSSKASILWCSAFFIIPITM